jgi:hypothetical protein
VLIFGEKADDKNLISGAGVSAMSNMRFSVNAISIILLLVFSVIFVDYSVKLVRSGGELKSWVTVFEIVSAAAFGFFLRYFILSLIEKQKHPRK